MDGGVKTVELHVLAVVLAIKIQEYVQVRVYIYFNGNV